MDTDSIISILKELTLDFVNGKRNRSETVLALHERIKSEDIDNLEKNLPQTAFIEEVYYSLDNLTTEDFAPSLAEMKYFADCFEGNQSFSREVARKFPVGPVKDEKKSREKRRRV